MERVLGYFKRWFDPSIERESRLAPLLLDLPADGVARHAGRSHAMAEHAAWHEGFCYPDWAKVHDWVESFEPAQQAEVWLAAQRAWVSWVCAQLPEGYRCAESSTALLLTAQDAGETLATLEFLTSTQRRIGALLQELAAAPDAGKSILFAFASEDDYYRYISHFYPEGGEYAASSGMHIHAGCSHFVVPTRELHALESVVVHEMTHAMLAHLPIPAWLNEGLAVNTEQRLTRTGADGNALRELESRHRSFWTTELIQSFWSGHSYLRPEEGNELSYDLGRLIVHGLSRDWPAFKRFVMNAHQRDAGNDAAHSQLGLDLGEFVREFLGVETGAWAPDPRLWEGTPEKGRFRAGA